MKKMIALLILGMSSAAFGAPAGNRLSPESVARDLIDDAAGDSWAEGGDVQKLEFTGLKCDLGAAKCELGYKLKLYDKPLATGTCTLTKISGYDDLIQVVKYGFVLKDGIYEQVDACMTAAGI